MCGSGAWRTGRTCGKDSCVEVVRKAEMMFMRDSKVMDSPVLQFVTHGWDAFVTGRRDGDFK